MVFEGVFLNPAGLALAGVLVPFLLLYLIKPKPRHETIPSLLFFLKDLGKSNVNSFLRTFLRDFLFLFQLLALLALIAAAAQPYLNVPRTALVEQTVLLVDVSASMQAGDRFQETIRLAKQNVGSETTLILIKESPEVVVERAPPGRVENELDLLRPLAVGTGLTDALQLAQQYVAPGARVVVLSDFIPSTGDLDYGTAADALEAAGAIVDYFPVSQGGNNVGIIDLLVGSTESRLWIKNYESRPKEVTLRISEGTQQVVLAKGETREITFKTPAGVAEIAIQEQDDLAADNTAWISTPEKNTISMMILTNKQQEMERSNFMLALDVIARNFPTAFQIQYSEPPKIGELNHDIYIVSDANLGFVLPGYVRDIKEKVENGAALLLFSQSDIFSLDWLGMLPVEAADEIEGGRATLVPEDLDTLTQDLQFGQVPAYLRVKTTEGATVVVKSEAGDPLIALKRQGKGVVLYYGIEDDRAGFSNDPSYPVFWRRTFDLLTDRPSLANLNLRTGNVLALPKETAIRTPSGTVTANLLPLDESGLYVLPDRTLAVNLLNDRESAIMAPANVTKSTGQEEGEETERVPKELTRHALWAALAILLVELLYVKFRGDF